VINGFLVFLQPGATANATPIYDNLSNSHSTFRNNPSVVPATEQFTSFDRTISTNVEWATVPDAVGLANYDTRYYTPVYNSISGTWYYNEYNASSDDTTNPGLFNANPQEAMIQVEMQQLLQQKFPANPPYTSTITTACPSGSRIIDAPNCTGCQIVITNWPTAINNWYNCNYTAKFGWVTEIYDGNFFGEFHWINFFQTRIFFKLNN
jgi:hypothetical protein